MESVQGRSASLGELEQGIPDERAVAEHPDVALGAVVSEQGRNRGPMLFVGQAARSVRARSEDPADIAGLEMLARQGHGGGSWSYVPKF